MVFLALHSCEAGLANITIRGRLSHAKADLPLAEADLPHAETLFFIQCIGGFVGATLVVARNVAGSGNLVSGNGFALTPNPRAGWRSPRAVNHAVRARERHEWRDAWNSIPQVGVPRAINHVVRARERHEWCDAWNSTLQVGVPSAR